MPTPKKRRTKKKKKLSPEERKKRATQNGHRKIVRTAFRYSGFKRVAGIADKSFTYQGTQSDFDDAYVYENIIVLCEYTTSQESDISSHLKKKKVLYDKIANSTVDFINFMKDRFPSFKDAVGEFYDTTQFRLKILYCSYNQIRTDLKREVPNVEYYDYNIARYFESVATTIRSSARYELFEFLGLHASDIAEGATQPENMVSDTYMGSVLPEAHSNLGAGLKVVSFYINPQALLERSYVLRRHGWKNSANVYQRMISRKKVEAIRKYLFENKRVFVNNIIVTLSGSVKLLDEDNNTINTKSITTTQPTKIMLPKAFNSVGIVDGQHRIFSYHEGGIHEAEIQGLRKKQNLLVTGIIFPQNMSKDERFKFEARLFLEINSNQTNAKSDLKHEIGLMLKPFAPESIAKSVVNHLNELPGPLNNEFERFFYDKEKIKTTSIVSYAVRPLVGLSGEDSLFKAWRHTDKNSVESESNFEALQEYIQYCTTQINHFISGVKRHIPRERWSADRKTKKRFLTTTNINGLLSCLKRLARDRKLKRVEHYIDQLKGIEKFPFEKYKSSQYNRLGEDLYTQFFTE